MRKSSYLILVLFILWGFPYLAENYVLVGRMGSKIRHELRRRIIRGSESEQVELRFVVPRTVDSPTYRQEVDDFLLTLSPQPRKKKQRQDERGNQIITAIWKQPPREINTTVSFNARTLTTLEKLQTKTPGTCY